MTTTASRTDTSIPAAALDELRLEFRGAILDPGTAAFDEARRLHNGAIDHRPALIARCTGQADVQAAVRFARDQQLPVTVRSGGHGIAGTAVGDAALVIDLSLMKGIWVGPERRLVAQAGVTWGELDREAQTYGLATTGGAISTTGVAGLTLGGGLGWLMRRHGLACDNLVSAAVVLADGSLVTASANQNPDLFWALRGGGGNFGVVTSFEFAAHPIGPVLAGMIIHPIDAARDVLRAYRSFTQTAPDELTVYAGLITGPDGSKVAAFLPCYSGPLDKGEELLRPLIEFGNPVVSTVGSQPYVSVQRQLDAAYPRGALNYWKSSFLAGVSDELIDVVVDRFSEVPSPMTAIVFEHLEGAVARVPVDATAFAHRSAPYNMLITSVWSDPADNQANIDWTRGLFAAIEPFRASGVYVNYLDADDIANRTGEGFGGNLERLRAIKARYDPTGVFGPHLLAGRPDGSMAT